MNAVPEFTTVVAVDDAHVPALLDAWINWRDMRPELLQRPLLVVAQTTMAPRVFARHLSWVHHRSLRICHVEPDAHLPWEQFEREAVRHTWGLADTPYLLRLALHVRASLEGPVAEPFWFYKEPVLVGATGGRDAWFDQIERWADAHERFKGHVPLCPCIGPNLFFVDRDWLKYALGMAQHGELPAESLAIYLSYVAARLGQPARCVCPCRLGWILEPPGDSLSAA